MKKLIISCVVLMQFSLYSQSEKLKFDSGSLSLGSFVPQFGVNNNSPFYSGLDIVVKKQNNLFLFSGGGSINLLSFIVGNGTSRTNFEISLSYGRRLNINSWLSIEGFAGIGFFQENFSNSKYETWEEQLGYAVPSLNEQVKEYQTNNISFPLKSRLLIKYSKKYYAGLYANYSINSLSNMKSIGFIFKRDF